MEQKQVAILGECWSRIIAGAVQGRSRMDRDLPLAPSGRAACNPQVVAAKSAGAGENEVQAQLSRGKCLLPVDESGVYYRHIDWIGPRSPAVVGDEMGESDGVLLQGQSAITDG